MSVAAVYVAIGVLVLIVFALSARYLPSQRHMVATTPGRAHWWLAFANWDGWWYRNIAIHGYAYARGDQSAVAFFPAYPLLLRVLHAFGLSVVAAGLGVTFASGLVSALLFSQWTATRLRVDARRCALLLLLLFPYAFYLYSTLYADAFFLATTIGAFVLLERRRPVWAGLVGALAAASRPVGMIVVVGLAARAVELRRRDSLASASRPARRGRDLAVLLAASGFIAYCVYLWVDFGNPLAFVSAERGWHQPAGLETWLKVQLFTELSRQQTVTGVLRLLAHPLITIAALGLVPRVWRRFGWSYALYVALIVAVPAVSTKDFFGMARYAFAAFPCFAIAGELLARREGARLVVLGISGVLLLLLTSLFARGYYLS